MIDAVLGYHLNPQTCGVAKFNHRLAQELGVPYLGLEKQPVAHPLVSIKSHETEDWPLCALWYRRYDLFLHDRPAGLCADAAVMRAERVFAANAVIARDTSEQTGRTDIVAACCPSTIDGNPTRGAYRVLTFGMAHKRILPHYEALKAQLDREHPDYTVALSTAVHEGSPWDVAMAETTAAMRGIFGDKLRVLGYLGDDALAKELQECDAVALYFDPALRANNTTAWAAIDAGKPLYTNTDAHSPPLEPGRYTWARLVEHFR